MGTYDEERELAFLEQQVLSEEEAGLGSDVVVAWNEFRHVLDEARQRKARAEAEGEYEDFDTRHRASMRELFETHERAFGEKFRQLRIERGWSQDDIAEKMTNTYGFPMHQTTVAKIEGGKRPLRVAELFALSFLFKIPVPALFYMRLRGEPHSIKALRERIQQLDEAIDLDRKMMEHHFNQMVDHREERDEVVKAIGDAAQDWATREQQE